MSATAARIPRRRLVSQERRDRMQAFVDAHRSTSIIIGMTVVGVLWIILPQLPPLNLLQSAEPWYDAFANAGVYMLLAMGLNIVVGLTGLLDLGYAAFFAIGSYTYAYSNSPFAHQDLPFLPMLVVGAAVAALFGIALGAPTLRLRGDYLAIMTLGFGEIVPIVFLNLDKWTEGTNGISGIYRPEALPIIGEFSPVSSFNYMVVMLFVLTVAMMLIYRLHDSRIGRAWMAIREDELAAAANGINTVVTKLLAFAIGATTSGFAGVFNASKLSIVSPDQFLFAVSFTVMAMVIIGGMGNIWGVAAGAFVVYLIQAVLLKQVNTIVEILNVPSFSLGPVHVDLSQINFLNYQFLLYGVALVLMMLRRPEGLFPSQARRAELHEVKNLELATVAQTAEAIGALGETPGAEEEFGEDAGEGVR
jgi:ABC-type branched-subunit amino acid transport system permease subunit